MDLVVDLAIGALQRGHRGPPFAWDWAGATPGLSTACAAGRGG
jgi:hypothetical protein